MQRHWTVNDFILTSRYLTSPAEHHDNGVGYGVEQGYCRKCSSDMQRFVERYHDDGSITWGTFKHYNSHKHSRGR